jgi:hypothetical protein
MSFHACSCFLAIFLAFRSDDARAGVGQESYPHFECFHSAKLVNQRLKPGNYRFVADEST